MSKLDQLIDEMNLFEKASFFGISFSTINGIIGVDKLWHLPLVHDRLEPRVANLTEILALYRNLPRTTLAPARCNNELAVEVLEAVISRRKQISEALVNAVTGSES